MIVKVRGLMLKKLLQQLKSQSFGSSFAVSPIEQAKEKNKRDFLKKLSQQALNLYDRQTDINRFTELALSNPENSSHNEIMSELFNRGVDDFGDENEIYKLIDNDRFRKDLGL